MPSIINATTTNGLVTSADNSGSLQLATNSGTTAVTIDTSQNVGIGTTTPAVQLHVRNASNAWVTIERGNDVSNIAWLMWANSNGAGRWGMGMGTPNSNNFNVFNYSTSSDALRVDTSSNFSFNSGYGSAGVAYGCRAWANINQQGTQTILASGNVSSIGDAGVGLTTVNFATAMPDTGYSVVGGESGSGVISGTTIEFNSRITTQFGIRSLGSTNATAYDFNYVGFAVFR
jgi:hypothetical protein